MSIIDLSKTAQAYYESLRAKSLAQGWDKYVATNGEQSLFVKADYEPQSGEAVFFLTTRAKITSCQLYKQAQDVIEDNPYEDTPQYSLTALPNLRWRLTDHDHSVNVEWTEGLFNETQQVALPQGMSQEDIINVPKWMKDIGDYLALNHEEKVLSDIEARSEAISILDKEEYWLTIAAALNGTIIDWEDGQYATFLAGDVEDYVQQYNMPYLEPCQEGELLNALDSLPDEEAKEVTRIIEAFWESNRTPAEWARDVLWWSSYIPKR